MCEDVIERNTREDFGTMIYLDNAATTPMHFDVLEEMMPFMKEEYGNPDSPHSMGKRAKEAIEKARAEVAKAINAEPNEILFTSGGTESNNWVIKSFSDKEHTIAVPATEHHSVLRSAQNPCIIPVTSFGNVITASSLFEFECASVMLVNNETGVIHDIKRLVDIAKARGEKERRRIYFHTDATQALGKIPIDVKALGVDYMTLSGHKIHGPKGIGALYVREGDMGRLVSLMDGGLQEFGHRAGTSNVPAIVGFGRAAQLAVRNLEKIEKQRDMLDIMFADMYAKLPWIRRNGDVDNRVPTIMNINMGVECASLVAELAKQEIYVSCGSACASKEVEPSHVLTAMGLTVLEARNSMRISTSIRTTQRCIDTATKAIIEVAKKLKEESV